MNWLKEPESQKKQGSECWKCESNYFNIKRCSACGVMSKADEMRSEKWNEKTEAYSDKALRKYARESTDRLLEKIYKEYDWPKYEITIRGGTARTHGHFTENTYRNLQTGERKTIRRLTYTIPSLQDPRYTHHLVAHETAHADPRIIEGVKARQKKERSDLVDSPEHNALDINTRIRNVLALDRKHKQEGDKHQEIEWQEQWPKNENKLRQWYPQYTYYW